MSDLLADSIFYWTFNSWKGDAYLGYTVADTAAIGGVPVGTVFESAYGDEYGFYTVTNVVNYAVDLSAFYGTGNYAEGANAVYSYYDASAGAYLPAYYGSRGIATTFNGLGGEFDYAFNAPFGAYQPLGQGGYYLLS